MGNSQSTSPTTQHPRTFKRRPSALFSRINLAHCVSIDSPQSQETFTVDHHDEKSSFHHPPSIQTTQLAYAPSEMVTDEAAASYLGFLKAYPEYRSTWILDSLRRTDYARLERGGETYVDFMGGALYPESLIRVHTDFLTRNVMGNTHSVSNSSHLSLKCANEARSTVLAFFKAPPEYTVIFTANATAALKLVGEAYPFTGSSNYILGTDSHNSVSPEP
jgi:molybdenum cofactor sulfurtransferase